MKFLVRVDDFPRLPMDCEKFRKFHEIMIFHGVTYLLGVTPLLSSKPLEAINKKIRGLQKDDIRTLKEIKKNIVFAYHGTTHQTLRNDYHSEFIGLDEKKLNKKIEEGLLVLKKINIKPEIIIPPFNTFDLSNLQVFKKYFRIVTGGPETIKIFGKIPMGNLDGILYVPSYKPLYGKPEEIYRGVKKAVKKTNNEIKCITFHWAWDIKNNFKYTEKICNIIKNNVIPWDFSLLQTSLF